MERAMKIAPPKAEDAAIENVARAIRAEGGGIAEANNWMLSHQK
jgi:hypothetical protein